MPKLLPALALFAITIPALHGASGALTFSTYLGGNGADIITAIATDASNNVYLTGSTLSSNFPVTPGAFQTKHAGQPGTITGLLASSPVPVPDAFVVKLNPQGKIIYATYLGGSGADTALAIAVDSSGAVWITGTTTSQNFPVTTGAFQIRPAGNSDIFVAKLSPDGATLVTATLLGGSGYDAASTITVDATGNIYIGGQASADFPTTSSAYRTQGGGAFIAKLNPSATALLYSTFLGDTGAGSTNSLAIDSTGNVYAAGITSSPAFPATPGALRSTIGSSNSAAFAVKLDPSGTTAIYSSVLGGHGDSSATHLALDTNGDVYLTGNTDAADFPVTSAAFQKAAAGSTDAFVLKLNPAGSALLYSTFLGGAGVDRAAGLTIDSTGNAFISGTTFSTDFPVTTDALPKRFAGSPCLATGGSPFGNPPIVTTCGDAFAAKLDPTGSSLTYATYLSGSDADAATAVAIDTTGAFYVAGWTRSNNFPIAASSIADARAPATCTNINSPSSSQIYPCEDGFVARIDFNGPAATAALRIVNFGDLLDTPVAPSEVVTLFGANIGPASPATLQLDSSNHITTVLSATRVLFDGVPAPLIRADTNQITAIVPNATTGAHSVVSVERNGQIVAGATVVVGIASPALLTLDPSGTGPCAAVNLDGTLNSASSPVAAGGIVSLFAIGMGATTPPDGALATAASNLSPSPVIVVGNQVADLLYAGQSPTMTTALTQLNIRIPATATGQLPVYLLGSGFSSQFAVTVFVK